MLQSTRCDRPISDHHLPSHRRERSCLSRTSGLEQPVRGQETLPN